MAVLAAAIMFTIAVAGVLGGVVSERGRVAVKEPRRPPRTSVTLILFSVLMVGAVIGDGLERAPSTPPSMSGAAPSTSQSAVGAVPVYPGPSNDAPLPRLNLPITYNYGPGPRHPVPSPGSAPPAFGANGAPARPAPSPSTGQAPLPTVPLPSCTSAPKPTAGGTNGPPVTAPVTEPCVGPSVPAVP